MNKIRFAVFIAIFLLISGCGGIQDEDPISSTQKQDENMTTTVDDTTTRENTIAGEDGVSVRGGTLSVDADTVFSNILNLIGLDAYRPIVLIENQTTTDGNGTSAILVDDFGTTLGLTLPENKSTSGRPGGFTGKNTVHILPGNGNKTEVERVLAHEFVHVIQYQKEWPSYRRESSVNHDVNGRLLSRCLSEGSATYLTDEYVRRYSVDVEPYTAFVREEYLIANGTRKYLVAPYYFCSQYFHFRLDSPANVTEVYKNPPVTTEQVIHNYTPKEEPPKDLDITVNETDASWDFRKDSTKGELFTRVVLANTISEENASRAAAGWGNDRLLEFQNDGEKGYVWILRWDSTDDAYRFSQSFDQYLEARGVGTDDCLPTTCFDQQHLGPRTTAVLVGRGSFLSNVTIERENSSVRVSTA